MCNKKILLVIAIVLALACSACTNQPDSQAEQIAARLGVQPATWTRIQDYLDQLDQADPPKTRDEVHAVLDKIGSYEIYRTDPDSAGIWDPDLDQPVYSEEIYFIDKTIWRELGKWSFDYTKQGILLESVLFFSFR